MKTNYKKSVAVFGLAMPLLFLAFLIAAVLVAKGRVSDMYQVRERTHQQGVTMKRQLALLENKVRSKKERLQAWQTMLSQQSRSSFTQDWKDAGRSFKRNEFQSDLPAWKSKSSGLGGKLQQPASQVTMTFDASFRAMQTVLMEMETKLPQMQMDSMSMNPNPDGRTMNFKTTFTVWKLH